MKYKQKLFPYQGRNLRILDISKKDLEFFFRKVSEGIPYGIAANLIGISRTAVYSWASKGENFIEQPKHLRNPKHEILALFAYRLKKAKAIYLAGLIDSINDSSPENLKWNRDFKLLVLRDCENWGPNATKRNRVEMEKSSPNNKYL